MTEITEEMWKVVEARIEKMPSNIKLSIGNASYNKEDLLENVKERNEMGKLIAMMEINYRGGYDHLHLQGDGLI